MGNVKMLDRVKKKKKKEKRKKRIICIRFSVRLTNSFIRNQKLTELYMKTRNAVDVTRRPLNCAQRFPARVLNDCRFYAARVKGKSLLKTTIIVTIIFVVNEFRGPHTNFGFIQVTYGVAFVVWHVCSNYYSEQFRRASSSTRLERMEISIIWIENYKRLIRRLNIFIVCCTLHILVVHQNVKYVLSSHASVFIFHFTYTNQNFGTTEWLIYAIHIHSLIIYQMLHT